MLLTLFWLQEEFVYVAVGDCLAESKYAAFIYDLQSSNEGFPFNVHSTVLVKWCAVCTLVQAVCTSNASPHRPNSR